MIYKKACCRLCNTLFCIHFKNSMDAMCEGVIHFLGLVGIRQILQMLVVGVDAVNCHYL